jgi:hypothetical protein
MIQRDDQGWLLMHRKRAASFFATLFLVLVFVSSAAAQSGGPVELTVGLKPGAEVPAWPEGVVRVRPIPGSRIFRVWVEGERVEEILSLLREKDRVAFAEKAATGEIRSASAITRWDIAEPEVGLESTDLDWQDVMKVSSLLKLSEGGGVLVAVLDTGVDLKNTFFSSRVWHNPGEIPGDGRDNDGNGYVDDVVGWDFGDMDNDPQDLNSHGTNVSSVLLKVAPACTLLPVKLNPYGASTFSSGDVAEAIFYAIEAGARVINLSFSMESGSQAVESALRSAHVAGVVLVGAGGNDGAGVEYPASLDTVIAVGSLYESLEPAWFSPQGPELDITAPGVNIEVIDLGGFVTYVSGTSLSAPMVSGAAAVLRSMNPHLGPDTVKSLLLAGALDLGEPGRDPVYGAGALDGSSLFETAAPRIALLPPPLNTFAHTSPVTVGVHLPPIDTIADVFVAVEWAGTLYWLDGEGVFHSLQSQPLRPLGSLNAFSDLLEGILFGEDGVFSILEPLSWPLGHYQWGIALTDGSGALIGPITWTEMVLY